MNKRLIIFVGVYDTLDIFAYELQREFENMGYETMLFDSSKMQQSLQQLALFVQQPVTAAITFNNLGYNMELTPGKNIWEELGVACINILMDHPFCYKPALDASPSTAAVLCTDRNHMRYVQRFYPQIPVTGYLPHAGIDRGRPEKKISDRKIDVLYAGGLSRKFAVNVMPDFTKYTQFDAKKVADEAYEMLLAYPYKTTEQAIEEVLAAEGVLPGEKQLCAIIADLHYIDLLAASYYREKVIRTLVEKGVYVHLYGYGWDTCSWIGHPNLCYGGRVSAEEIIGYMQNAKIVLSTMTWFKDGTHDRVFNGMLAGAGAVTDTSVYMREEFPQQPEDEAKLLLFELEEIAFLPEKLKGLLDDTGKNGRLQQMADRGFDYAMGHHTWKNRAEELDQDLLSVDPLFYV